MLAFAQEKQEKTLRLAWPGGNFVGAQASTMVLRLVTQADTATKKYAVNDEVKKEVKEVRGDGE